MRIISRRPLRDFWNTHPGAEQPLKAWWQEAAIAAWATPHEIKAMYGTASVVGNSRIVFNIAGNKYRLVVKINYAHGIGYIRFIGTHAEYDKIDASTI